MIRLEELRARRWIGPLDEHFARTVTRIGGDSSPEVLLAAALVSRQTAAGHVCLDLPAFVASPPLVDAEGAVLPGEALPEPSAWRQCLDASPLVGDGTALTPLVLDAAGRLYLHRYWDHQNRLAAALVSRASAFDDDLDRTHLRDGLDRLFPPRPGELDRQRLAAVLALRRRFCVISGGPGTGKTATVVKILALLIEQAFHHGLPVPRIRLLAPTGKAAARLAEAIRRARGALDCAPEVREAIPGETSTIHRCLRPRSAHAVEFRHDAENPLPADLVLVDEASMVDVALMARLVDAVPGDARLILLGDRDQLASVEAGAVLGDICNAGEPAPYSAALVDDVGDLLDGTLCREAGSPERPTFGDCIVQLTRSYRYECRSGIGALARAINAGDVSVALEVLRSADFPDVGLGEPLPRVLPAPLARHLAAGFRSMLGAGSATERLARLDDFRVLCAHRSGPGGVESLNDAIERALENEGRIRRGGGPYPGQPILITRNDYGLRLFNGDIGVVVEVEEEERRVRRAVFPTEDGVRNLSPAILPPFETVFAMTVHKSQGSELDRLALALPPGPSPVVSRELLYTAVTRARHAVTIHGSEAVIAEGIRCRIRRDSGLRGAVWGARPRP